VQTKAFQQACIDAALELTKYDAELLIIGDTDSPLFSPELKEFTERKTFGGVEQGKIKVNFLVNYG
jgi:undecaprenyl diphosphate synthase